MNVTSEAAHAVPEARSRSNCLDFVEFLEAVARVADNGFDNTGILFSAVPAGCFAGLIDLQRRMTVDWDSMNGLIVTKEWEEYNKEEVNSDNQKLPARTVSTVAQL
eukprot:1183573-Prorocentrum_minimum.AAC.2